MKKNLLSIGAYANTLTGLIGSLYAGMNEVSREAVGFIPSVTRNTSAERAAAGQVVTYPIAPSLTSSDIVPAMAIPEPTDRTIGTGSIAITKAKCVEFGFVGEEQRGLNNGAGFSQIQADLFAEGVRTLVNEMETDLGVEAAGNACRSFGTAGTTPFGSNVGDAAQMRKILIDTGAPLTELSGVIDSSAGASLRTLANLTRVNEAGTTMTLRDGELLNLSGFSMKESAGVQTITKGTAASATTNTAGYAIGATVITLASAGTGTILAGDYVTFAGDANKYLVVSGDADVSGGGTITLSEPGLVQELPASAVAITLVGNSARNIFFPRSAIHLVTRAPALVNGEDAADESMMLTDRRSGMSFEVRVYKGYRKTRYEVGVAWGVKAVKRQHIAALLG
jgi:hypothetical protein